MFKRVVSIGLIFLFLALSYNKVANWHIHIVNGIAIRHAHANTDTTNHHHSHSKTELLILNIINGTFWNYIQMDFLPSVVEIEIIPYYVQNSSVFFTPKTIFLNKSPPIFV